MGYTAKQACETLDRYLNLSEKEIIENTEQLLFQSQYVQSHLL